MNVTKEAKVTFVNCSFTSESFNSVRVIKGAVAKFYKCEFLGSKQNGLNITDAECLVQSCSFHSNSLSSIQIRNSSVEERKENENFKRVPTFAVIQDCKIFSNLAGGIEVTDNSFAVLKNNKIFDNKEVSIFKNFCCSYLTTIKLRR